MKVKFHSSTCTSSWTAGFSEHYWILCQNSGLFMSPKLYSVDQQICFSCQYHAVFIAIALQHDLKSGMVISLAVLLLLFRTFWLSWDFCFLMKFKIVFSIFVKNCIGIWMRIVLNQ